ncbi:hypothetical protein ACP70R_006328 [Stipagrostis hirtigluma subsp. patula]
MELPPWTAYLAVALVAVFFLKAVLRRHVYNLPPGPKPWPIIGNLNLLGKLPHRSIHELSKRYGPLMQLRFGSLPVVVGSSVEMAKLFFKTHDAAFCDRPRFAAGKHMGYDYSDMLWAPYGAYFRQARKIFATELFSAKRLESLEHVADEEVRAMLRDIHTAAASGRAVVRLRDYTTMVTLGVICRIVLGKKYVVVEEEAAGEARSPPATSPAEFGAMADEFVFLSGAFNIGDLVPWLDWLDLQGYVRRMKRSRQKVDQLLDRVLDEHNERRRREGERFVARDMVDVLLHLADDPNLEVQLSRDNVKALIQDLFAGATDSSSHTIEWAISELLKNPGHLAKAIEELDRIIGRDRPVTERDLPDLPFVEAVIKETLRLHPAAPLLAPHLAREDVSVGGYDVPAGTIVLMNVWSTCREPTIWDAPEEFRPERFIGSKVDVRGQDFELLPFGSGRRMCPGYNLALKVMQLSVANLLQGFTWRLPDGVTKEELSMEETYVFTTPRKVPLEAVVQPRLPVHLYTLEQWRS